MSKQWNRGMCGACGSDYDHMKSTASNRAVKMPGNQGDRKAWQIFCSKDCEKTGLVGSRGYDSGPGWFNAPRMADGGPIPEPTQEPATGYKGKPIQTTTRGTDYTPTQTGQDGSLQFGWPGQSPSHTPKGAPIMYQAKTCVHDAQDPAFTLRGGLVTIYGARASSLMNPATRLDHIDLIIDASGNVAPRDRFVETSSRKYQGLNTLIFPEVIRLRWPDMTAPTHVGIGFWQKLLAALPDRVCLSCIGSHGRTGTAMASLLVADGMEADVAIQTVRAKHCKHAIETAAQADYIRKLQKQRDALTP